MIRMDEIHKDDREYAERFNDIVKNNAYTVETLGEPEFYFDGFSNVIDVAVLVWEEDDNITEYDATLTESLYAYVHQ